MITTLRAAAAISAAILLGASTPCAAFTVEGVEYAPLSAAEAEVTGADKTLAGRVAIPAAVSYDGATYAVTAVGDGAFEDCSAVTSLEIPGSVVSVGNDAFSFCSSLAEVVIADSPRPLSLGYIPNLNAGIFADAPLAKLYLGRDLTYNTRRGHSPFSGSEGLKEVSIGAGVSKLGERLFSGCASLKTIASSAAVPPAVGASAFAGVDVQACRVTVPIGTVDAYASAAGWSAFANITDGVQSSVSAPAADVCSKLSIGRGHLSAESLPEGATITLYSIDGREALTLGGSSIEASVAPGMYIMLIQAGDTREIMKVSF
ncbi:MAG: leucine-rich repeat domain-containing protein [[Clostridium] fimetarium]|nr:leucine-rich repeat domain-containing protein [Alistipes timonensis]MCM1405559.1 leucine-rich repeat domain-containing protein [[Clostridium] fimetarium]